MKGRLADDGRLKAELHAWGANASDFSSGTLSLCGIDISDLLSNGDQMGVAGDVENAVRDDRCRIDRCVQAWPVYL